MRVTVALNPPSITPTYTRNLHHYNIYFPPTVQTLLHWVHFPSSFLSVWESDCWIQAGPTGKRMHKKGTRQGVRAGELSEINSWHGGETIKTYETEQCACVNDYVCVFKRGLPISIKHIMLIKPQRTVVFQLVQGREGRVCMCGFRRRHCWASPALLLLLAPDLHGE